MLYVVDTHAARLGACASRCRRLLALILMTSGSMVGVADLVSMQRKQGEQVRCRLYTAVTCAEYTFVAMAQRRFLAKHLPATLSWKTPAGASHDGASRAYTPTRSTPQGHSKKTRQRLVECRVRRLSNFRRAHQAVTVAPANRAKIMAHQNSHLAPSGSGLGIWVSERLASKRCEALAAGVCQERRHLVAS